MVPQSLSFRVNDNVIKSGEQNTFTPEDQSLTLSVLTHDNYTYEGACLMVSSGMKITSGNFYIVFNCINMLCVAQGVWFINDFK
jgi:hypothetical protein